MENFKIPVTLYIKLIKILEISNPKWVTFFFSDSQLTVKAFDSSHRIVFRFKFDDLTNQSGRFFACLPYKELYEVLYINNFVWFEDDTDSKELYSLRAKELKDNMITVVSVYQFVLPSSNAINMALEQITDKVENWQIRKLLKFLEYCDCVEFLKTNKGSGLRVYFENLAFNFFFGNEN